MRPDRIAAARSFLFVPGDRPERFDKALASGADQVIIDLEDAVAAADKATARAAIGAWLADRHPVLLRISPASTPDFQKDLDLCGHAGIAGIVLAKTDDAGDVEKLREAASNVPILPLIETAKGLANAEQIARSRNVVRLMFGSIDFQLDLGIPDDGEPLAAFRSALVLASRLGHAASPVDGVTTDLANPDLLKSDVERARRFGFGGKLCIHPRQVDLVNRGFMPTPAEIEWARSILAGVGSRLSEGQGAIAVDGQMIDRPVLLKAQGIIALAGAAEREF